MLARKSFVDTLEREDGGGLGVEVEVVVVGGVRLLNLGEGAWAGGCCEVDGCWVGVCLLLCTLGGGLTDTLGEDTGDVRMVVGVVSARERCVEKGVLVMEVVAENVVHAGVSGDETGREEEDVEEGDTVEAVDVVCTANGLPQLKDRCVDSWVVIVWAYSCWRDGVGFDITSLSLTFGVSDLCGCLYCGGFRSVGRNTFSGIPRPQRYVYSLLHGGKRDLPPGL
ncbi:hypothetical protein NDU88_004459 [Pleurodeles waltl]|uniref:Uncharacterized protein n=1 Tax=Pleurodeles waltl TaxID=8319 RepID=A0AAV7NJG9_PLEWA|nr:hypothetical protein NDU88_004459 [Pleurodeles waltl]